METERGKSRKVAKGDSGEWLSRGALGVSAQGCPPPWRISSLQSQPLLAVRFPWVALPFPGHADWRLCCAPGLSWASQLLCPGNLEDSGRQVRLYRAGCMARARVLASGLFRGAEGG